MLPGHVREQLGSVRVQATRAAPGGAGRFRSARRDRQKRRVRVPPGSSRSRAVARSIRQRRRSSSPPAALVRAAVDESPLRRAPPPRPLRPRRRHPSRRSAELRRRRPAHRPARATAAEAGSFRGSVRAAAPGAGELLLDPGRFACGSAPGRERRRTTSSARRPLEARAACSGRAAHDQTRSGRRSHVPWTTCRGTTTSGGPPKHLDPRAAGARRVAELVVLPTA